MYNELLWTAITMKLENFSRVTKQDESKWKSSMEATILDTKTNRIISTAISLNGIFWFLNRSRMRSDPCRSFPKQKPAYWSILNIFLQSFASDLNIFSYHFHRLLKLSMIQNSPDSGMSELFTWKADRSWDKTTKDGYFREAFILTKPDMKLIALFRNKN